MHTPRNFRPWLRVLLLVFAPLAGFGQTLLEDFESFALGVRPANHAGSFTIVDGAGSIGSGKAAQVDSASMQHRFTWTGDPQPVITVSYDMYSGSAITEAQALRFSFNLNSGGLMTGTNNIARLAMLPEGRFDIEAVVSESYTDDAFPHDTPMTVHIVFNSSDIEATYADGGALAPNTLEVWKEIDGVLSHVGQAPFNAEKLDGELIAMGFATNSTYGTEGDFIVDNLRWVDGVFGAQRSDAQLSVDARGVPSGGTVRLAFAMSDFPAGSTYQITADQPVQFVGPGASGPAVDSGAVDVQFDLPGIARVTFTLTLSDASGRMLRTSSTSLMVFDFDQPSPFPHPSIMNTQVQLDALRATVLNFPDSVAGREWARLRARADSSLQYQHNPRSTVFVTASGSNPSEDAFRDDAHAARNHALQWVVTGDTAHRDKAVAILSDWGNAFQEMLLEGGGIGDQIYLESAWALPLWAAAADIIRYYDGGAADWDETDMAQFAAFLHTLYEEAYKIRLRPSVRDYASIGEGYHNWSVSANWAMMAYGAWSGHLETFEEGLNNLFFMLDDFSLPTGEINETCRDTFHPQYSIVTFTDAAELAYTLGYDDLYMAAFDGQQIPRLAVILEYFANLMLGRATDPCSPNLAYSGQHQRFANYEAPYNHYINRMRASYLPAFQEMVETAWRASASRTAQFLDWSMLTHGLESSGLQFWHDTFTLDGCVDTFDWMQLLYVAPAPWIYSFSLQNWMLMPEELMSDQGAWVYIMRRNPQNGD
jgi:hypothetical protein